MELFAALLLGLALGGLVGWLAGRPAAARLQAELDKERAVHAERLKAYSDAEAKLREAFQALSADALKTNNEAFLAARRNAPARRAHRGDRPTSTRASRRSRTCSRRWRRRSTRWTARSRTPSARRIEIGAQLHREDRVARHGRARTCATETRRLVDALKRPGVRGRWGELQLKRVVELAGMVEHCDFNEQQTIARRRRRPHSSRRHRPAPRRQARSSSTRRCRSTPTCRRSKRRTRPRARRCSPITRGRCARICRSSRPRATPRRSQPSPDFVVMFLPGEMFFSAALEQDPSLIEFGVERNASSPRARRRSSRCCARWRTAGSRRRWTRTRSKISELGRNLYESVRALAGHFDDARARA